MAPGSRKLVCVRVDDGGVVTEARSLKALPRLLLGTFVATWTTYVLWAVAAQVTRMLEPIRCKAVIRNTLAEFVGSVSALNSAILFIPSPSGSAQPLALGQSEQPKYRVCHSGGGSGIEKTTMQFG